METSNDELKDAGDLNALASFMFVMDLSEIVGADSFDFADSQRLRKATTDEIALIKRTIGHFQSPFGSFPAHHIWEKSWCATGPLEDLPQDKWRYFVIAFEDQEDRPGRGMNFLLLQLACDIAPVGLETAIHFLDTPLAAGVVRRGQSTFFSEDHFFQFVRRAQRQRTEQLFHAITSGDLQSIASLYKRLGDHGPHAEKIRALAFQVQVLKRLPPDTPLNFLGYFSVLEAMLTHPPKPTDPYDSITRQVKMKLQLLNRRFENPLNYDPFEGATPETIWGAMYRYRSVIAHGGRADFAKDLKVLQNRETALQLIDQTTRAVIRQFLTEPQLVADLRDC